MGQPAAKQGDIVSTVDGHIIMVPSVSGLMPIGPIPHPFNGILQSGLSTTVFVESLPAALLNSVAINQPPHIPIGGVAFQIPPTNQGIVMKGSGTVFIDGQPAARNGDMVQTCADPAPNTAGAITAISTVFIGG